MHIVIKHFYINTFRLKYIQLYIIMFSYFVALRATNRPKVDSKGGDGDVRWELSSHPGSTSSNATAQVTASDNTSSTSVRLP